MEVSAASHTLLTDGVCMSESKRVSVEPIRGVARLTDIDSHAPCEFARAWHKCMICQLFRNVVAKLSLDKADARLL